MPFGIVGRTGPGMRQVEGFGDRYTEELLITCNNLIMVDLQDTNIDIMKN